MNISKRMNSAGGAKYIKLAMNIASKLRLKFQSKKIIVDGFVVEGKKTGSLRSATVLDLPQDLVFFPVNLKKVSGQYLIKPVTYAIPNRDALSPFTQPSTDSISFKHDSFVTNSITFGDVSDTSTLSYHGIVNVQGACVSQSILFQSGNHQELKQVVLHSNFSQAGANNKEITSFEVGGDELYSLFQRDLLPIRTTYDRGVAEAGDTYFISARDNNPVSWYSHNKCFTLMTTYDNYYYDVEYEEYYANHNYCTYVSHLSLIVVQHNKISDSYEISGKDLNIDSFLPSWIMGSDIKLIKPSAHSLVYLKAAREYKIHSIREMADGNIVIASTMKKLVPIEDLSQWPSKTWALGRNNELAYLALVSMKITIKDEDVVSVDILDADVLCGKNLYDGILSLPSFSNINRNTFSTDMMLDVLSNGSILCRRQVLARPNNHATAAIGGYYPLSSPHYAMTIDGVYRNPISSNESSGSYIGLLYILNMTTTPIMVGQNNSSKVSGDITAVQWYEPKPLGGQSTIGIMFVDTKEDRFKVELSGYPDIQSDVIGLSCPQEEVRDDNGELITPSVIIAVLQKDGDLVVMIRKGPIFDPDNSDGAAYWSEPVKIESANALGVLYAKGSSLTKKNHGQYFNVTSEVII